MRAAMECNWIAPCHIHIHLVSTCISSASPLHSPWLLHRLYSFARTLLSDQTERRHSTSFLFEWQSLRRFLFPVPILCCHSSYTILTTELWIGHKFAFTLVTICPRPPSDVLCQTRSLTPVYQHLCCHVVGHAVITIWSKQTHFISRSERGPSLCLPLTWTSLPVFLNPDCSHADLQPRTLGQLRVHREIHFDSYSPSHQTLPVEAVEVFSAAQTTQEAEISAVNGCK